MERSVYVDCARSVVDRLRKEVNGLIRFEVYPEVDTIIFKIVFKEFDFRYALGHVQDLMLQDGFDEAIDIMLKKYKSAILNGFFKTYRKEGMYV